MDYRHAMKLIDFGRGMAGRILGPPCTLYRTSATSAATNFIDPKNVVQSGLRIGRRQKSARDLIEAPILGTLFYSLMIDGDLIEVGDVIVENDPYYGSGATEVDFSTDQFEAYCPVYHGPFKETMAARIDRVAYIYRPATVPQNTTSGLPYWQATLGQALSTMLPLQLNAGLWSFGAVGGAPSQIPIGLTAQQRHMGTLFKDLPGSTGKANYYAYVPPLDSYVPKEGDRLVCDGTLTNGGRYVVEVPYTQFAGAVGSQLVLQREVSQS